MACCGVGSTLFLGADIDVFYTGARTRTGTYLNAGTCTWQLYDASNVSVATGTLTYDGGSNGDYYGVIESTVTAALTPDASYYVVITFAESSYNDARRLPAFAAYRGA